MSNFKNRLFGRTRGRSKKKIIIEDYFKLLNQHKLTNLSLSKQYILDIGTGYGETSIYLSKKFPAYIIISCEKYIDGNLNLIKQIRKKNIKNIKIYEGNVLDLLDNYEIKKYFEQVNIFFPDPWPKKRHHKRRLITELFLKKLYPFIIDNGEIYIATDSTSYSRFILKNIYHSKNLYNWSNQSSFYLDTNDYIAVQTKFYKKAIISGRKPSLFILKKI